MTAIYFYFLIGFFITVYNILIENDFYTALARGLFWFPLMIIKSLKAAYKDI